jgi:hypothetical protein
MEQQEPWVLLTQEHQFPWHFRVKVAGHVVGRSMELQVPVFARKQDLPSSVQSNGAWSLGDFRGRGSVMLSCK